MDTASPARLKSILIWAWILFPLVILVLCVARYFVDVPHSDMWSLVPLIQKMHDGTLTLPDLLASTAGQHRPFFPKLWMLALARLSSWNLAYELAGNILLAAGFLLVMRRQLQRTFLSAARSQPIWLLPLISMILFSLQQSWLKGYRVPNFMSAFFPVLGFFLLAGPNLFPFRFWAAFSLGVVSTLSMTNGLLSWPIGFLILWAGDSGKRERVRSLWVWGLLSAGILGAYVLTYTWPPKSPTPFSALQHPFHFAWYLLSYLGSPMLPLDTFRAGWLGATGILLCAWTGWNLHKDQKISTKILLPYGAVIFYVLGTAVLTAIGRGSMGIEQILVSRYVPLSNLFWISILILLALRITGNPAQSGVAILCVLGIALLTLFGSFRAQEDFRRLRARLLLGRAELFRLQDDSKLRILHPKPDLVKKWTPILQKYRLSIFRNEPSA